MFRFAALLDTRAPGMHQGVKHKCAVCGRGHAVWACFRGVRVIPEGFGARIVPTDVKLVTGRECARKIPVPIYEEAQLAAKLDEAPITPGSRLWDTLFTEFR